MRARFYAVEGGPPVHVASASGQRISITNLGDFALTIGARDTEYTWTIGPGQTVTIPLTFVDESIVEYAG